MAPKVTIKPGKEALIRDVLSTQFGREISKVSLEPRSNNSTVYILSLGPASTTTTENLPRRPGTEALPLGAAKAVMRFTNPKANLNDAVRVQCEVAAMTLARDALQGLDTPLVPRVYGWSSASADKEGWTLMEFMPGTPLDFTVFRKLSSDAKKDILDQIARAFKYIQQCEFPASVKGYGGLSFAEDGSITLGPTPIHGATRRCETYHELYTEYLHTQLAFMDKCDIVQGWNDSNLRERIDNFVAKGFKPLLELVSELKPRQALVHGDFDLHNLLFDARTNRLTALLDWDFSHVASAADEYFYSFDSIHGLVAPRINEDSRDALRQCLLHGFDVTAVERKFGDMVNWDLAALTNQSFSRAGVQRPVDMMPGIEPLSELYWFIQNLSPGVFYLPAFRAKTPQEKMAHMRKHFKATLEEALCGWGF